MKKITLLAALTSTVLVGCGSSDDAEKSESFQLQTYTSCLQEEVYSNAQVLFHNSNGDVIAHHKTDNQGILKTALPENAQHFSIMSANANSELDIITMLNAEDIDYGKFYLAAPNGCSCTDVTLNFDNLSTSYDDYRILRNGYDNGGLPIEVCQELGLVDVILANDTTGDVRSALIDVTNTSQVDVTEDMFSGRSTLIEFPYLYDDFTKQVSGIVKNVNRGRFVNYTFDDEPLYSFNDHAEKSIASIYRYQSQSQAGVEVRFLTLANQLVPDNGVLEEFTILDLDANFSNAFQAFSQSLNNENGLADYDFSSVSEQLDQVDFSLYLPESNYGEVYWQIVGPVKAQIPDFKFNDTFAIEALQANQFRLNLRMYAFQFNGNYSEFRRAQTARQKRSNLAAATTDFTNYSLLRVTATY